MMKKKKELPSKLYSSGFRIFVGEGGARSGDENTRDRDMLSMMENLKEMILI